MKKVLVAVDGSDKSLEAADYAMSIANKGTTDNTERFGHGTVVLRRISVWLGPCFRDLALQIPKNCVSRW